MHVIHTVFGKSARFKQTKTAAAAAADAVTSSGRSRSVDLYRSPITVMHRTVSATGKHATTQHFRHRY